MAPKFARSCFLALSLGFLASNANAESLLISNPALFEDLRADQESIKGKLSIKVPNLRSKLGQVCVSLFNSEDGFPADSEKAISSFCMSASEAQETGFVSIEGLPFGTIALALFHDENSDKKLNTGIFGIPLEGFAFSNNPALRIGAPGYQECTFTFSDSQPTHLVELRYLR
jgi:uncharacterized protein (DUF2141 family)